ncbi:MAG TPA: glutathione peroxidase [Phycisphaerae bacterium]|nr:glutathione peroxidase [Phycisphaerae bacterium]
MKTRLNVMVALILPALLIVSSAIMGQTTQPATSGQTGRAVPAVLNFTMTSIEGQDVNLAKYEGNVILIVNTASKCGFTPQYAPLEALYKKYANQGFVILGFPENDFHDQEPGTDIQISQFCTEKYGVTFDMFSKIDVIGPNQCPLYKFLTDETTDPAFAGPVKWNFEKFLIARDGTIVARFRSKIKPDSPQVVSAIEAQLAKPLP